MHQPDRGGLEWFPGRGRGGGGGSGGGEHRVGVGVDKGVRRGRDVDVDVDVEHRDGLHDPWTYGASTIPWMLAGQDADPEEPSLAPKRREEREERQKGTWYLPPLGLLVAAGSK